MDFYHKSNFFLSLLLFNRPVIEQRIRSVTIHANPIADSAIDSEQ